MANFTSRRGFAVLLAILGGLLGCSADAVDEPEPVFTTPGAFIAWSDEEGGYRLLRMRNVFPLTDELTLLFFDEYLAGVASLEEAKQKAQDPALPLVFIGPIQLTQFRQQPHVVVWFRTLTEEERNANGGL